MHKLSIQNFSNLISKLYHCESGCDFSHDCLPSLAEIFSSDAAALVRLSDAKERDRIFASLGFDQSQLRAMMSQIHSYGCALFSMDQHIAGKAHTILGKHFHQTNDSPGDFQDLNAGLPSGKHWLLGVVSNHSMYQSLIWFCRDIDQGEYSQDEREILELFLPHLQQATKYSDECTEVHMRLEAVEQIINRTPFGMFILTVDGVVLSRNEFAQRLVDANDKFIMRGDKLIIQNQEIHKHLKDYFDKVRNSSDLLNLERFKFPVQSSFSEDRYIVKLIPMSTRRKSGILLDGKFILLQVHTPDVIYGGHIEGLDTFYNLTNAEVKVCQHLFISKSLSSVAAELKISVNTVKTHLSRSFHKIGVSSQAELLQKLALHPRSNW